MTNACKQLLLLINHNVVSNLQLQPTREIFFVKKKKQESAFQRFRIIFSKTKQIYLLVRRTQFVLAILSFEKKNHFGLPLFTTINVFICSYLFHTVQF